MSKKSIVIRIAESRVPFVGSLLLIALGIMGGLGVFGHFGVTQISSQQSLPLKQEFCTEYSAQPPVEEPRSVTRLNLWFSDIEKEAARLDAEHKTAEAEAIRGKLADYKSMFDGKLPVKKTGESEVHVVGVYEGDGCIHGAGSDKRVPGYVSVDVKYTDNPVTLVLVSYEPVIWKVNVAPGVKLTTVYADGYYEQTINGIDKSVPIIRRTNAQGAGILHYAYDYDSNDYRELCSSVKQVMNKNVSTFLGKYNTRDTFVIGSENTDWRAQMTLKAMDDFHSACIAHDRSSLDKALRAIDFEGIWVTGTRFDMPEPQIQFGKLTVFGPEKGTLKDVEAPAFAGVRGKEANILYLAGDHGVAKFNTATKQVSSLVVPKPLPELSWVSGIAHDTRRGHILVSAHQTTLYSYDENNGQWKLIDTGENLAVSMMGGLTYFEPEDCLYAISTDSSTYRQTLHKLNLDGKIVSSVPVSDIIYPFESSTGHLQLQVSGNYVIGVSRSDIGMDDTIRTFAIDRTNGRVLLSKLIHTALRGNNLSAINASH